MSARQHDKDIQIVGQIRKDSGLNLLTMTQVVMYSMWIQSVQSFVIWMLLLWVSESCKNCQSDKYVDSDWPGVSRWESMQVLNFSQAFSLFFYIPNHFLNFLCFLLTATLWMPLKKDCLRICVVTPMLLMLLFGECIYTDWTWCSSCSEWVVL